MNYTEIEKYENFQQLSGSAYNMFPLILALKNSYKEHKQKCLEMNSQLLIEEFIANLDSILDAGNLALPEAIKVK